MWRFVHGTCLSLYLQFVHGSLYLYFVHGSRHTFVTLQRTVHFRTECSNMLEPYFLTDTFKQPQNPQE